MAAQAIFNRKAAFNGSRLRHRMANLAHKPIRIPKEEEFWNELVRRYEEDLANVEPGYRLAVEVRG